jgi:HTH-type transcriptional regulator / antitoxin HigA
MIAHERQYQHTRKQIGELEHLLTSVLVGTAGDEGFRDIQQAALEGQLADLQEEVAEYEALRSGATTIIESPSLAELPDALIKARIARGWTQADLARALGVAEQQIQRYEASRYNSASFARLCDVASALEANVCETITLRAS